MAVFLSRWFLTVPSRLSLPHSSTTRPTTRPIWSPSCSTSPKTLWWWTRGGQSSRWGVWLKGQWLQIFDLNTNSNLSSSAGCEEKVLEQQADEDQPHPSAAVVHRQEHGCSAQQSLKLTNFHQRMFHLHFIFRWSLWRNLISFLIKCFYNFLIQALWFVAFNRSCLMRRRGDICTASSQKLFATKFLVNSLKFEDFLTTWFYFSFSLPLSGHVPYFCLS